MRVKILCLLLLIIPSFTFSQVSIGTETPLQNFHVHDSTNESRILLSNGLTPDEGLVIEKDLTLGASMYNLLGDLRLKSTSLTGEGGEVRLFSNGSVGVGSGVLSADVPKTLSVVGSVYTKDSLFLGTEDNHLSYDEDTLSIFSDNHLRFRTDGLGDYIFENRNKSYVHFDGSRESVGIGVENAIQELEVDGDVLVYDTLYMANRFNKIYADANMYVSPLTNLRLQSRSTYDIEIMSGNTEYATFEGENKRFGVGTNTPEEKVDVIGTVKADHFKMVTSPVEGYVLTSDEDGLATWQVIPKDDDWTVSGSDLYTASAGTVTIGTAGTPSSKLNVNGSLSLPIFAVSGMIYTPTANDHTVIMSTPGSSILLPDPTSGQGRVYVLKFSNGGVPSVIQSLGTLATIDGLATFPVPNSSIGSLYTTIVVQSDGASGWWIINY